MFNHKYKYNEVVNTIIIYKFEANYYHNHFSFSIKPFAGANT